MKKINNIFAVAMMVLGVSSSAFAINEKQNFRKEYNEIKTYAEEYIPKAIESDFCVAKFEAQEVFSRIDGLLNKVYKYLKNTKDQKAFDLIKIEQRKWINDKEADAKLASKTKNDDRREQVYEQYRVYNEYTFKRCSELIDMVEDNINAPEENKSTAEKAYEKFSNEIAGIERYAKNVYADETLNQHEINHTSEFISKKWAALMEEMVGHLKTSLDAKSAENLKKAQEEYKKLAEATANAQANEWEGGSGYSMALYGAYSDFWEKRCKALLEDVKNNSFAYDDTPAPEKENNAMYTTKYAFIEAEETDRDNRFGSSRDDAAYLKETQNIFAKWDTLLNDVYKHLKETLDAETFEIVKKAQRNWIKEKEEASAKARSESRGGNADLCAVVSDTDLTKERIKALIELVED